LLGAVVGIQIIKGFTWAAEMPPERLPLVIIKSAAVKIAVGPPTGKTCLMRTLVILYTSGKQSMKDDKTVVSRMSWAIVNAWTNGLVGVAIEA
jgi:stage III sporulation protein SpoIIIAA